MIIAGLGGRQHRWSGSEAGGWGALAKSIVHGSIAFDPDFASAKVGDSIVVFTRSERLVLQALKANGGRALSRSQLLDVVSGSGSPVSDRSVDFTITRLRRKLGDDARAPRFIATRYGDGYAWVAAGTDSAPSDAFIVVGPLHGLDASCADMAMAFGAQLARHIDSQLGSALKASFDPDRADGSNGSAGAPRYSVTLSFLPVAEGRIDFSVAVRHGATGAISKVFRSSLADRPADREVRAAEIATAIVGAIWTTLSGPPGATPSATEVPLPIRLHEASEQMGAMRAERWRDAEVRLRAALERDPDDGAAKLMLATALHSKYVTAGAAVLAVSDPRPDDEREMEALVTSALPAIQGNDIHVLIAAKLLDFVSPMYADLALDMAERAFTGTTAFATAFTTLGQMRMYRGDIADAVSLFERGSELAEPGSHFWLYLRVLLCDTLLAAGDLEALSRAVEPLFVNEPLRHYFAFPYPPPAGVDVSYDIEAALTQITPALARGMIQARHYMSGRLFRDPQHRRNIMGPISRTLVQHFGPTILPDEALPDLPADLRP